MAQELVEIKLLSNNTCVLLTQVEAQSALRNGDEWELCDDKWEFVNNYLIKKRNNNG
jgi:hypothetical protein